MHCWNYTSTFSAGWLIIPVSFCFGTLSGIFFMFKGFRQIACLTALSRVFGMLRDMAFAHFLGADWLMTAWTMGFKIPNLSRRLFGEGAAAASFIPVYSQELEKDAASARRLACTVLTVVAVVLLSIVLAGECFVWVYYRYFAANEGTRVGLKLCSVMLPYMISICLVAILAGILQVHRHFAAPAAAPIVLNIIIISSLLLSGWVFKMEEERQIYFVACGVLFAGLVQIGIQIPPLRKANVKLAPAWDVHSAAFKRIIIMMGPMIIGLTVTQINTLADDLIALGFSREDGYPLGWGAVSNLYYAQRMYQLPLGVFGISLATAIFPVLSTMAAKKDYDGLAKTVSRGIGGAAFLAVPATAGLILVARPVIAAVFEHGKFTGEDTAVTAMTLSWYAVGLTGFFSQQILTRAFYSMQDSKTPMYSAVLAVCVNVVLNLTLIWFMGTGGLALSTAVCSYLQVFILVAVLRKRIGHSFMQGLPATVLKTAAATFLMTVVSGGVLCLMRNLPKGAGGLKFDIFRLVAVVLSSVVVYYICAVIMRNEGLSLVVRREKA